MKDRAFSSRQLGLVTPDDTDNYDEVLEELTGYFEKNVSFEELEKTASFAEEIVDWTFEKTTIDNAEAPVIAVAKDEAFCFFYEDNLTEEEQIKKKLKI